MSAQKKAWVTVVLKDKCAPLVPSEKEADSGMRSLGPPRQGSDGLRRACSAATLAYLRATWRAPLPRHGTQVATRRATKPTICSNPTQIRANAVS